MPAQLLVGLDEIRSRWGWYLITGVILSIIGVAAIVQSFAASIASMTLLGWLVILSGLVQAMLAFRVRIWSGFFLHLMGGVLEVIVGLLIVAAPASAAIAVTLLLAVYLLVSGLFRTIAVLLLRFPGSGTGVLGGLISFLLGLALWHQWPMVGLIFIGTCVGVALILHGASWISFALTLRKLPVLLPT
jgi:uncharacterized membrane protein HdeD (DUF308 family)